MRPWLARFAFSMLILACYLGWHAYRIVVGRAGALSGGRALLEAVAAVLCVVLAVTGIRERHRGGGDDRPG